MQPGDLWISLAYNYSVHVVLLSDRLNSFRFSNNSPWPCLQHLNLSCRSSIFLPVSPCSLVSVLYRQLQTWQWHWDSLWAHLRLLKSFPYSSDMSMCPQCPTTLTASSCHFWLEWFWYILDADQFHSMIQNELHRFELPDHYYYYLFIAFIFCIFFPSSVYILFFLQQKCSWYRSRTQIDIMSTKLWPGCSILDAQALLSERDLGVRSRSFSVSDNRATAAHTHTHNVTLRCEEQIYLCVCSRPDLCSLWFTRKTWCDHFTCDSSGLMLLTRILKHLKWNSLAPIFMITLVCFEYFAVLMMAPL